MYITNNKYNANAGLDQSICIDNATITANIPETGIGTWTIVSGNGAFDNSLHFQTQVRNLDYGANTFRWTVDKDDCINSDEVNISNYRFTINAGEEQQLCQNSTFLNGENISGSTGIWTVVAGSVDIIEPEIYNSEVQNISYGANTLKWRVSNNDCYADNYVTIANYEFTTSTGSDEVVCENYNQIQGNLPMDAVGEWVVLSGSSMLENFSTAATVVSNLISGDNVYKWNVWTNGWMLLFRS